MLSQRFVPAPNASSHKLLFSCQYGPAQFGLWVVHNAAPSLARIQAASQVIHDWWTGTWKAHTSADYTLNTIVGTDESVQVGAQDFHPVGEPGTGGTSVAPNVAMVVKVQTGFRGRSARGRFYVPGIETAAVDAARPGQLNAGHVATYTAAFEALRTDVAASVNGPLLGVVSRYSGYVVDNTNLARPKTRAAARPGNAVEHPASALIVRQFLRTQKRRASESFV